MYSSQNLCSMSKNASIGSRFTLATDLLLYCNKAGFYPTQRVKPEVKAINQNLNNTQANLKNSSKKGGSLQSMYKVQIKPPNKKVWKIWKVNAVLEPDTRIHIKFSSVYISDPRKREICQAFHTLILGKHT